MTTKQAIDSVITLLEDLSKTHPHLLAEILKQLEIEEQENIVLALKQIGKRRKVGKTLSGVTIRQHTAPQKTFVTVNNDKDDIIEVFVTVGKEGNLAGGLCEALGRIISIALQYGVPCTAIENQIIGIRSQFTFLPINKYGKVDENETLYSYPDAIGKAIKQRRLQLEKNKKRRDKKHGKN